MAHGHKAALRYARATFDYLGGDAEKCKKVIQDLRLVAGWLAESSELTLVWCSDLFSEAQRLAVLDGLAAEARLSEDTLRLLRLLSRTKRLALVDGVAGALEHLVLEAQGVAPIRVEAAQELSAAERARVEKQFASLLGKKVSADYVQNPALLGGLRVTAQGRTFNGTLSGWLQGFEEKLVGG